MPPKLLCCGRNFLLLRTRQLIFQSAGFATEITAEMPVVKRKLRDERIDILVLCHSLGKEDWDAVRQAAQNSFSFPILLFLNIGTPTGKLQEAEISYDPLQDPAGLLDLVKELLLTRQVSGEPECSKRRHRIRQKSQKRAQQVDRNLSSR